MAQERIEIFFKPTGDKALIRAIKELDSATKNLQGRTSIYDKELRKLRKSQQFLYRLPRGSVSFGANAPRVVILL